jgi:hypothetical protein
MFRPRTHSRADRSFLSIDSHPLSKKLHSLPSSIRRIIQPRGWRVLASRLVATAEEGRLILLGLTAGMLLISCWWLGQGSLLA